MIDVARAMAGVGYRDGAARIFDLPGLLHDRPPAATQADWLALADDRGAVRAALSTAIQREEGDYAGAPVSFEEGHQRGWSADTETLERVAALPPALAERVVDQMDRQMEHRIALERAAVVSRQRRSWCGLAAGWTIAMTVLWVGAFVAVEANALVGGAIVTANVIGLTRIFLRSESSSHGVSTNSTHSDA